MYEQFFGLTEKPFSIQPDPSFLYWGRTHRLAYAMLEYGVLNHAGISVITGEVGCGKTTLIHRLLDQLSDTHTVSLLSNVQEGRGDLLSWVLMSFGQPFAGKSHVELFAELQSFFIGEYAKGKRVVLIIDEAQNLSADMLEELRLLSNINAGKDQLLQLILVGQPQLKDLLNRPELLQLAQRVGSDFHLTPLTNEEVQAYIETRLAIAGCRRRIFTERAIDLVSEQSRGVPRVINIIADTALVYAFSAGDLVVGVETIRTVIRDKMEYGVFGLASDDIPAPVKKSGQNGPDAFVRDQGAADAPVLRNGESEKPKKSHQKEKSERKGAERRPEAAAPLEEPYDPAPSDSVAKTVADLKTTVQTRTAPQAAPAVSVEQTMPLEDTAVTGVVVIGVDKNILPEAAIRSAGDGRAIVFASVGASQEANAIAREAGAVVVDELERSLTTGGRARNAAYRQLKKIAPHIQYVQFVDANNALDPDWITRAEKFMVRRPEVAIIEGQSVSPKGKLLADGVHAETLRQDIDGEIQSTLSGSALMRADSFEAAGGFRGDLRMSETIDLCVRLRRRGGHVWRLSDNMLICDPKLKTRSGWWSRGVKRGVENAYNASLHGGPPERLGVMEVASAVFWGFAFPFAFLIAAALGAVGAMMFAPLTSAPIIAALIAGLGFAIYGAAILITIIQRGIFKLSSWRSGFSSMFARFAEFLGVLRFWLGGKKPSRAVGR